MTAERLDFLLTVLRDFEQDYAAGTGHFRVGGEPHNPAIVQCATATERERVVITFRGMIAELVELLRKGDAAGALLQSRLDAAEERHQEDQAARADLMRQLEARKAIVPDDTADRWADFIRRQHCIVIRRVGETEIAIDVEGVEGAEPVSFCTSEPARLLEQFLAAFAKDDLREAA